VGRCGGDEFMVVFLGSDAHHAAAAGGRVRSLLAAQPFETPGGDRLPLPVCCGVAATAEVGRCPSSLIAAADSALYSSKGRGGDAITLHLSQDEEEDDPNRTKFDVLNGLVTAIDHKDRYTKKHSEDVTQYALALADALQLSDETMSAVRIAGLLHDVGKIGVPDGILRKPGKLTDQEFEVMKGHVTISSLIIHGLPYLTDIIDAVAHHHERWDGRGYPNGCTGTDIPLLGRVMAVADAFSAMTLDRPYRAAMSVEAALAEIEKGAGTQFDPELARIFVDTMRAKLAADLPKAA
jgi:putative nucleotidyltransferase with HDIG domain